MSTAFSKQKLKQSRDAIQSKRWEDALTSANEVLQFEKDSYNALVFRAVALLNLGKHDDAERDYVAAAELQPKQTLAWQGLEKFYTEAKQWNSLADILKAQMDVALEASQPVKCAEKLQSLVKLQRKEGSSSDIVASLSLLLSDSPFYGLLCTLDPPDQSAPTRTSTFETQMNIYVRSLDILQEVVRRTEELEASTIANETKKRRMRLHGANKSKKAMSNEVGVEVWGNSKLPSLYQQITSHPSASDELRHETESKLLRYQYNLLLALPNPAASVSGPTGSAASTMDLTAAAKQKSEAMQRKEALRNEVITMAEGLVIIRVPDELAWTIHLESRNAASLADLPLEKLRASVHLLPRAGWALSIKALLILFKDQLFAESEAESARQRDVDPGDTPDALTLALDGLDASPASALAQHIAAALYLLDEDFQSAYNVAETCLSNIKRMEEDMAIDLSESRFAVETLLACALARLHPPQYHARAQRYADNVLAARSQDIDMLLTKAFILESARRWADARSLYQKASKVASSTAENWRSNAGRALSIYKTPIIQAECGVAWCEASSGQIDEGIKGIEKVIEMMETDAAVTVEEKARAWWRLGQSKWLAGGDQRTDTANAYTCFITSIKQSPVYAPAFTSLGLFYETAADPPDLIRAAKCFQKAFELDAREDIAARKLAEGFADDREWDLVDVVARRTISGEGGDELLQTGSGAGKAHATRNSWAWKAIGAVELHRQKYDVSIRAFQTALRADPGDATAWQQLGEAYASSGKHVAALKTFAKALELAPSDWTIRYAAAEVQRQLGNYQASIDEFHAILEDSEELSVRVALAETQLLLGGQELSTGFVRRGSASIHRALQSCLKALIHDARIRSAWKVVADGCFQLSRNPPSVSSRQKIQSTVGSLLELAKGQNVDDKLPSVSVVKLSTIILHIEGQESNLEALAGLLRSAIYFYKLCVVFNAADDDAAGSSWADLAIALYHLNLPSTGLGEVRTDDETQAAHLATHQAIGCLREALRHEPGNEDFWLALGNLTFDLNPTLAQHSFIRAIENAPSSPVPWSSLGVLYLHNDDVDLANQAFISAQTVDPDQPEAWVGQALVARHHGDHKAAQFLFEHAFQLCEGSVLEAGYGFASEIFALFGTNPPAPQLYSPAFALSNYIAHAPTDSSGLHLGALFAERLGSLALAAERVDRAATLLEAAYEKTERADLAEHYAIAKCNAGRLHLATEKYEEAIDCYEATLSLVELVPSTAPPSASGEAQGTEAQGVLTPSAKMSLRRNAHVGGALARYHLGQLDAAMTAFEAGLDELGADDCDREKNARLRSRLEVLLAGVCWATSDLELRQQAASRLTDTLAEDSDIASATTLGAIALLTSDDALVEAVLEQFDDWAPSEIVTEDTRGDIAFIRHMVAVRENDTQRALTVLGDAAAQSQSTSDALAHAGAVLRTAVSYELARADEGEKSEDATLDIRAQAQHAASEALRVATERIAAEGRAKIPSAQVAKAVALLLTTPSSAAPDGASTTSDTKKNAAGADAAHHTFTLSAVDQARILALEAVRADPDGPRGWLALELATTAQAIAPAA